MGKELPLLLNGDMVRAVLDGSKTQTRRPVKPQPIHSQETAIYYGEPGKLCVCPDLLPTTDKRGLVIVECTAPGNYHHMGADAFIKEHCPFGQVGDTLWVRETFWHEHVMIEPHYPGHYADGEYVDDGYDVLRVDPYLYELIKQPGGPIADDLSDNILDHIRYAATDSDPINREQCYWEKRPSIHMPRWASRLRLTVTNVRVQRVHDISDADVRAEGVSDVDIDKWAKFLHVNDCAPTAFGYLWDSIYGKQKPNKPDLSFAANPWVWAITFEVNHG